MLDSLNISGFKTGIVTCNNALLLKNTRFINCGTPVQQLVNMPGNKYISGTVAAFKADTVPVKSKPVTPNVNNGTRGGCKGKQE